MAIIIIIVIGVLWFISALNKLNQTQVKIEEAESGIDIALVKRFDTLTKLLDITKNYMTYEKETLVKIVEMRSKNISNLSVHDKNLLDQQLGDIGGQINVTLENYPDLKSSNNVKELQIAISDAEEHLQAARRAYNSNVSIYNRMLVTIPTSLVASTSNHTKKDFFQAEDQKKQDVKMDFN